LRIRQLLLHRAFHLLDARGGGVHLTIGSGELCCQLPCKRVARRRGGLGNHGGRLLARLLQALIERGLPLALERGQVLLAGLFDLVHRAPDQLVTVAADRFLQRLLGRLVQALPHVAEDGNGLFRQDFRGGITESGICLATTELRRSGNGCDRDGRSDLRNRARLAHGRPQHSRLIRAWLARRRSGWPRRRLNRGCRD